MWPVILLCALLLPSASEAQLFVKNKFVTAEVDGNLGLVTISTTRGGYYGKEEKYLTFNRTSFLTVRIDGKCWTNNIDSKLHEKPDFAGYLRNGETRAYADTLETTWKLPMGDLIQTIYPVAYEYSGQIMHRWRFKNRTNMTVYIENQYLLDTRIVGNDRAKVLTRFGYRRSWSFYYKRPPSTANLIPPFYQAFQNEIDPPSFNPGLISQGTMIDPTQKLMMPDAVAVGQWTILSYFMWEWPDGMGFREEYVDSGVLMRWGGVGVIGGVSQEIGSTLYGTGQMETCFGELYALIFRPRTIRANVTGDGYDPNPFDVEMYLFNTNKYTEAANQKVTLKVGPHLKIVSPTPSGDSTTDTQIPDPPTGYIGGVSTAKWRVRAEPHCEAEGSWMEFQASSNLSDSNFIERCRLPVSVPCLDRDTLPPVAEPKVLALFEQSIDFHDRRLKDKGIDKVILGSYDPAKFDVSISPFAHCTNLPITIRAKQLDSTFGWCIPIEVIDCAGNRTQDELCFPKYPLHPDDTPPRLHLIAQDRTFDGSRCNMKYDSLLAIDDTLFDLGLRAIELTPGFVPVNMRLEVTPFSPGVARHGFTLHVLDSMVDGCISIRATDMADLYTDTVFCYCTIPDRNPPVNTVYKVGVGNWSVFATDDRVYDRKLDTISVTARNNVEIVVGGVVVDEVTREMTRGRSAFGFNIRANDTLKAASFCVRTKDLADSSSTSQLTAWWADEICVQHDTVADVWAPNIAITPSPLQSATKVTVTVDDIHELGGIVTGWDRGIDSIWFTNVKGMIVPTTIKAHCSSGPFSFEVTVADTLAFDSLSTICVHTIDCAGNRSDTCWYYPIRSDELPPEITGLLHSRESLVLGVTDSTAYDRGLRHMFLEKPLNFNPFDTTLAGDKEATITLNVTTPGRSATGTLRAIDLFGSQQAAPLRDLHTSAVDVAVWVQDLEFKTSTLAAQDEEIRVPIFFSKHDTFSVASKGITEFEIVFELEGDPGFSYAGFDTRATASSNFDIVDLPLNDRITLRGASRNGLPLSDESLPLIFVRVRADASEATREVLLKPVEPPIGAILFNGDRPRLVTGNHASAQLPAPYGRLKGGVIVSLGSCSPYISTAPGNATRVAVLPLVPNPSSGKVNVRYLGAGAGPAVIDIYSVSGTRELTLQHLASSAGEQSIDLNVSELAPGNYYVRVETAKGVATRPLRIVR